MTATMHFVQPSVAYDLRWVDRLSGTGLPAGYEHNVSSQSIPEGLGTRHVPRLPLDILASGLGITKITVDQTGTERFSPPTVESTAAQRVTDSIIEAIHTQEIAVSLSPQRCGSILSSQAMNRLGRQGIQALVDAGFIVRMPAYEELLDGGGHCSVFPNPSSEFLQKLGELCGVTVNDARHLALHETSDIAMSSPLLAEPFWAAAS